ncbi:restriction endonuclease subunit S [uncultured Alistipes sp.]|uniref:restriction endonuclease subunit S n=3 Tax=uncultured Alistipes sp. TaxID=538949 RepID=UPI002665FB4E|nr:restriction endonuclease subunit S [uncultured Alistipes sp.]
MAANKNNKALNVPHLRFPEFCGEWKDCSIQDYGEVVTGNTPPTSHAEYYENGTYLWASPADLGINKNITETKTKLSLSGFKKTKNIPKGSVLVTCIGSTIGKMGMATETMASNQQINSIVVNDKSNCDFVYYAICRAFPRYLAEVGVQAVPILSKSNFEKLPNYTTCREEQDKIGYFLNLLDERIATQNKIIEKLETLIKGIVDLSYDNSATTKKLGNVIAQISQRNKSGKEMVVLSVNNKQGFIEQSEQFEERIIASDDTSNYKMVCINDFAYNPARINVGSIARLKDKECGIVSPMYICFRTLGNMLPEYLELFFKTKQFALDVDKRLEGSVRLCLSYEGLCEIAIPIIAIEKQKTLVEKIASLYSKLDIEKKFLRNYKMQKQYLLSQMFI